jgi:hypothetical protein
MRYFTELISIGRTFAWLAAEVYAFRKIDMIKKESLSVILVVLL